MRDAFNAGAAEDDDLRWLAANRTTAAKVIRFYAAAAWVWADVYLKRANVSRPSPNEFMKIWREAMFSQIVACFDHIEIGDNHAQMIWSSMFDDAEAYARIFHEKSDVKSSYLAFAVGKSWFEETQGLDMFSGYHSPKSGLMVFAAALQCQVRVEEILKTHCR
ncbi:MAG: hypothetical protein JNL41_03225 [Phenylobacterium sp.]|nr:hypothetical protein [Phenylobacterium sp.]